MSYSIHDWFNDVVLESKEFIRDYENPGDEEESYSLDKFKESMFSNHVGSGKAECLIGYLIGAMAEMNSCSRIEIVRDILGYYDGSETTIIRRCGSYTEIVSDNSDLDISLNVKESE